MFQFRLCREHFFFTPGLFFGHQPCEDPRCPQEHQFIGLAWLCWEAAVVFS